MEEFKLYVNSMLILLLNKIGNEYFLYFRNIYFGIYIIKLVNKGKKIVYIFVYLFLFEIF